MARSPLGFWEACGFPSAPGFSDQTFPWDPQQAQPWGKYSLAGNCSAGRRNPSAGDSHRARQQLPRLPQGWSWSRAGCAGCSPRLALHPAGTLGGRCPRMHGHIQPCRRDAVFPVGVGCSPGAVWELNSVAAKALGLQVKTSQNTFQALIRTLEQTRGGYDRAQGGGTCMPTAPSPLKVGVQPCLSCSSWAGVSLGRSWWAAPPSFRCSSWRELGGLQSCLYP